MSPEEEAALRQMDEQRKARAMALSQEVSPFEEEHYAYMMELVKVTGVPKEILAELWGVINQVHQLTWFDEKDIRMMSMDFDNLCTRYRGGMPEYEYDCGLDIAIKELEMMYFSMVRRSYRGFERKMQATQIRSVEYNERQKEQPRTGLLGKLKGAFGLGGRREQR